MLDRLLRFREPAALVIQLAVLANMVLACVTVFTAPKGSLLVDLHAMGGRFLDFTALLFLLLMTAACVLMLPRTKHARTITMISLVIAGLGALLTVAAFVAGFIALDQGVLGGLLEALGGFTDLLLKGVALFGLWHMMRLAGEKDPVAPALAPAATESLTATTTDPAKAVGRRWNTAAEATKPVDPLAEIEVPALDVPKARGVQPMSSTALDGPPAQANPSLWKKPTD